MNLLDEASLERSEVVANSRMNRERRAVGVNSYEKELGFSPISFLADRLRDDDEASWLDLCCGRGRALIDAAEWFRAQADECRLRLHGVDLIDDFDTVPHNTVQHGVASLQLESSSLHRWTTQHRFDLITCVHGLHYIGDKLRVIERASSWLSANGAFFANLDLANLRHVDGTPLARRVSKRLRQCGFTYNPRKHLLSRIGQQPSPLGFKFTGAQLAGPNYTGHEAVNSFYQAARTLPG